MADEVQPDPTEVGDCDACGRTEYLGLWFGRKLCHECAVRSMRPIEEPPPALSMAGYPNDPSEDADMIDGKSHHWAQWVAIVLLAMVTTGGSFAAFAGHQQQETQIQLLRQANESLAKQLATIEWKLDKALEVRK